MRLLVLEDDPLFGEGLSTGLRQFGHVVDWCGDGALRFDPATRQVHWRNRAVEVTGRELALLEALRKHPRRVLSKAQLQERLYDWSGGEPESNALEVHVHHLRRKIHPSIVRTVRTVRGVGYALGAADAHT